jgi:uncharacterized protein YhaN
MVFLCLSSSALFAQATPQVSPPPTGALAPGTDPELNGTLRQIEQIASTINLDVGKLRVYKWKADSASRRQAEGNIDSVQRNLTAALPQFIAAARSSPRNIAPEFRLYRNLNALSDVLNSIAESAGAFGPRDEYERLAADLNGLETARNALGKRVEALAEAQAQELAQLRKQLLEAGAAKGVPSKVVVDDNAPASKQKSTARKKPQPAQKPSQQSTPPPSQPPTSSQQQSSTR